MELKIDFADEWVFKRRIKYKNQLFVFLLETGSQSQLMRLL
jgi:hypothetical protein